MSFQITLAFLESVKENNNTERLHTYRDLYQQEKFRFADFIKKLLEELTKINPEFKDLQPKEYIFRFNRDIRFSHNKSPYKEHFGAVIAPGGKKSDLPCLYVHLESGNNSMIAGGLYLPPTPTIHKVRTLIAKHFKEWNTIITEKSFKKIYGEVQGKELVKMPR